MAQSRLQGTSIPLALHSSPFAAGRVPSARWIGKQGVRALSSRAWGVRSSCSIARAVSDESLSILASLLFRSSNSDANFLLATCNCLIRHSSKLLSSDAFASEASCSVTEDLSFHVCRLFSSACVSNPISLGISAPIERFRWVPVARSASTFRVHSATVLLAS